MDIKFPGESAEYRAARNRLLEAEIKERRAMEAVAAARRALPPGGLVPQDYAFDGLGDDGKPAKIKLSELFAPGTKTLIVYNMMFPRHKGDERPKPETGETARLPKDEGPCPSCTGLVDQFNGAAAHLEAAGFNFIIVAKAPLERLLALGRDRGWKNLRLLSSAHNDFKRDYHAEKDGQLVPMLSVFERDGDGIRHFWSSEMFFADADPGQDPRHNGTVEPLWTLMDLTREGRPDFQEGFADQGPAAAKPQLAA